MTTDLATRAELVRLTDELFLTADAKDWSATEALFSDGPIEVDVTSLAGGAPSTVTAKQLVDGFRAGLHAEKQSHHMTTNYRVTVSGDAADVVAHGYAWNRVASLGPGRDVWETWGRYRLSFERGPRGWRLTAFRYHSTRTAGNDAVRTHAAG